MYGPSGRSSDYLCTINNDNLVIVDSITTAQSHTWATSLLKNSSDEFYLAGIFNTILIAGNDTIRTDSIGNYMGQYNFYANNPFLAKFKLSMVDIHSPTADLNNFQIFPNPSSGTFMIQTHNFYGEAKVNVYDVLGNCLLKKNCREGTPEEINLSSQSPGVYFVELLSGKERVVRKVAIQ
jgi:hypothetical protein